MQASVAQDELAARYKSMATEGLVDVKHCVRNTDEATTERVCREVLAMYEALERGEAKPLNFHDRSE
jgi:hypothetical protein